MNSIRKAAKRIKESFNKCLEKMAKDNEKQFGSSRLDCCSLQKKKGDKTER